MLLLFMDFTTGCENKIFVRKTTFSPEVEYQDQNVGFYVIYIIWWTSVYSISNQFIRKT